MDIPLTCVTTSSQNLREALVHQDIKSFCRAIQNDGFSIDDIEGYDDGSEISVFEEACQTPDCAPFIAECIRAGCDGNKINPSFQKRPINFAVESHDIGNISALLESPSVNIDAKYANATPVNYLCGQLNNETYSYLFPCIDLFIRRIANFNIPDRRDQTPISTILNLSTRQLNATNRRQIVAHILDNVAAIDIDSYRNGEARTKLMDLMPDRTLPLPVANDGQWNLYRLMACLRNEQERAFLIGLNSVYEGNNGDSAKMTELFTAVENDDTLLTLAIKKGLTDAVERMIRCGASVNYSNSGQKPVEIACKCGQWQILAMLLKSPMLNVHDVEIPLISIVINKGDKEPSEKCDYKKCLELLMAHPSVDINQREVNSNLTALHYAAKNKDGAAINCLLAKGAFIGVRSKFKQMPIANIDADVLERHFDSCITTNGHRRADENFEIQFDYKNLVPPEIRRVDVATKSSAGGKEEFGEFYDEIASIDFIASTKELKHLIEHPLISSFLFLKWTRFALMFYVNFLLFAAFVLSTTLYILLCLDMKPELHTIRDTLRTLSGVLLFYICIRELVQLYYSRFAYFKSAGNVVDLGLIGLTVWILSDGAAQRPIDALVILLMAYELFVLAGSLPYGIYSTHFVMFKTVTLSFLKSFALYAIIIVAFSLSFFTLLHKAEQVTVEANGAPDTTVADDDDDFNRFSNVPSAMIKTLVMLTGEFDAASINFDKNIWNYVYFVTFLFLISTVLFNLLNGLAVTDIQIIKAEAELNHHVRRTQVLARYERILANKKICHILSIFESGSSSHLIRIKPNLSNQISVNGINTKTFKTIDYIRHHLGCGTRMDSRIVKRALGALDRVQKDEAERAQSDLLLQRIDKLETMLISIGDRVARL